MPWTPNIGKTILTIDDQPSVLRTLGWLLESRAYRSLSAELKPPSDAVDVFLAKPQDPPRLLVAVEQLVGPGDS